MACGERASPSTSDTSLDVTPGSDRVAHQWSRQDPTSGRQPAILSELCTRAGWLTNGSRNTGSGVKSAALSRLAPRWSGNLRSVDTKDPGGDSPARKVASGSRIQEEKTEERQHPMWTSGAVKFTDVHHARQGERRNAVVEHPSAGSDFPRPDSMSCRSQSERSDRRP